MNIAKVSNVNPDGSIIATIYSSALKTNAVRMLPFTQNIRIPYIGEFVYFVKASTSTAKAFEKQYQFYYQTPIFVFNHPQNNTVDFNTVTTKKNLLPNSSSPSSNKTIILEKKEGEVFFQGTKNQIIKFNAEDSEMLLTTNEELRSSTISYTNLDNVLVMTSETEKELEVTLSTSGFKNYEASQPYYNGGFVGNQMFLQSDNIVIDTKDTSLILSSNSNAHLVANDFVGIESKDNLQLYASQINIGKESLEPAVLGDTLTSIITDLVNVNTQIVTALKAFGIILPPTIEVTLQDILLTKMPNLLSKVVNISKNNVLTLEYPDVYSVSPGTVPPSHLIYSEEYTPSTGNSVNSVPMTNGLAIPSTDENVAVDNTTIEIEFQNLEDYPVLGNYDTYERGVKTGTITCYSIQGKPIASTVAPIVLQMLKDAKSQGVHLIITSGFRGNEDIYANGVKISTGQVTLRRRHALAGANIYTSSSKKFKPATAPPGYSKHQNGIAVDFSTKGGGRYQWMVENFHNYGFIRTVRSERWHWEYRVGVSKYAFVPKDHYTWDGFAT